MIYLVRETRLNLSHLSDEDAARTTMAECVSQGASPEAVAGMMGLSPEQGVTLWASISDGADQWEALQHD